MNTDEISAALNFTTPFEMRRDGYWAEVSKLDVRKMAQLMWDERIEFVTLTTRLIPDGFRHVYHWRLDGKLLNIAMNTTSMSVPSIADIWPAADWVEREVRDYYAIDFTGRDTTPPLMLREGDEPGLFSRTDALGRNDDPADTVRPAAGDLSKEGER